MENQIQLLGVFKILLKISHRFQNLRTRNSSKRKRIKIVETLYMIVSKCEIKKRFWVFVKICRKVYIHQGTNRLKLRWVKIWMKRCLYIRVKLDRKICVLELKGQWIESKILTAVRNYKRRCRWLLRSDLGEVFSLRDKVWELLKCLVLEAVFKKVCSVFR